MDYNLRSIVNRQKDVLAELENEVNAIENSDLTQENERLRADLEKLNTQYLNAEHSVETLSEQNSSLKTALYEQMYNEKLKLAKAWENKMELYFQSNAENAVNKLTDLENNIKLRIDYMTLMLHKNHVDLKEDIYGKLNELSMLVNAKVTEAKKHFAEEHGVFSQNERAEFEALKNEPITDKQVLAAAKKNNMERFVGLNLLNGIGILLIIIGVITAARYSYVQLPDTLKGIMMFLLGTVMLVAGEIMNRKKPNIFSLGVTAGGVGVLYVALATSHFGLKILDLYPALALCILITAVTFFLSTRYNSQTILTFALIGGYMPIFSLHLPTSGISASYAATVYGAMIYFVVLNLLVLIVSFKKKWSVASFIGLFLNIAGTIYITNHTGLIISEKRRLALSLSGVQVITILYILFAFLNYTLIPIVSTYINRLKFRKRDVVLLAINTFFSSLMMYIMFYSFNWQDFTGMLAILFAVIYLSLGWLIERRFNGEKNTQALFYLTGLTFIILTVPFQFGRVWWTLGWLAEGVALTAYGILKTEKSFKRAGFVINALCLWSFLIFDIGFRIDSLFAYKYLAMTVGSLIILGSYMYKNTLSSRFQKFYKGAAIVNLWFYGVYICSQIALKWGNSASAFDIGYLSEMLTIVVTFLIAYSAPRVKSLSDIITKVISIILYVIGIIWLFSLNSSTHPVVGPATPIVTVIGTVILVFIGLLSVFSVHDLMKLIVTERKLGVEWYPLVVSAYFLIALTQNLITQYHLSFASAWISIIYVLTALVWILFGFAKRYSFIRRFGLGLSLLAVVKLFIIDLSSLTSEYRIISYFVLGITLVAISFVYQYFNKRLELKMEVTENDTSKNH